MKSAEYFENLLLSNPVMMVRYDTQNPLSYLRKDWRRMHVIRAGTSDECCELGRHFNGVGKKGIWAWCAHDQPPAKEKFYRYDRFLDIKNTNMNWIGVTPVASKQL